MYGGGQAGQEACMAEGVHGGGHAWQDKRQLQHPTGMHSCLILSLEKQDNPLRTLRTQL